MATNMQRVFDGRDMRMGDFLLPDELTMNIFLQLPIKSLAQLRCVCKTWNQLITSKYFVESHLNRYHTTSKACILYHPNFYRPLELGLLSDQLVKLSNPPFSTQLMDWNILGSCNGVLCLCNNFDRSLIYMWNPVIHKYTALPRRSSKYDARHVGFGLNHLSGNLDDFRVVIIFANESAEVYSLHSNSWKSTAGCFPPGIEINCFPYSYPISVKGRVHWCAQVSCYQDRKRPWLIISFDFGNEVFETIILPETLSNGDKTKFLNVVNGRLCVFAAVGDYSTYELWVLMEYGAVDSWTRTHIIEKPDLYWWPLGFTRTGGIFAQGMCYYCGCRTLVTYEPDSETFTCSSYLVDRLLPIQVLAFVESLVAPVPRPLMGA